CIEDNRDNLIVILAGYSKEMEDFLESNSGLKSRFPNIIDFPDYTGEELVSIAKITAKSKGYVLDDEVLAPLQSYFEVIQATNAREAGNGRLVRNKVEEAILNQSKRLVAEQNEDMSLLKLMDFDIDRESDSEEN
ncbi:MAG: stage V sporulation protein K, partial [Lachnospiraceae bacterium]|nr:stage V sporulation protein K [Lachnospiraceae bacterium]